MKRFGLGLILSATVCVAAMSMPAAADDALEARLEADVRFLADDLMEGRDPGNRGYDMSAHYVAERMRGLQLKPGGDDGSYFQSVDLIEYGPAPDGNNSVSVDKLTGDAALTAGRDYVVASSPLAEETFAEGELVFAGYGFVSEKYGRNDFEGVDLEGKIAVMFVGAPPFLATINSEERAHFNGQAAAEASKRGAIGTLFIFTPQLQARIPFARYARFIGGRQRLGWVHPDGTAFSRTPNIQASATLSSGAATRLFEVAGHSLADIMAQAQGPDGKIQAFDMGMTARIEGKSVHRRFASPNVVGIVEGTDEKLRDEYVVVSAHLDHLGRRSTEVAGDDEIFNGAIDNSVGIAATLETARAMKANPPRRSVLFVTVTAEERGLIGSDYFAHYPTVPKEALAAVVNIDMPIVMYDFQDLVAFGAERSTLFGEVEKAARDGGLTLSPDPMPEQGIFTRSDHYRFVQQGIPAVFLMTGFANGGQQAWGTFLQTYYHQLSDEIPLVNFEYLARFASIKRDVISNIGNMDERPKWRPGDFFGETFDGPMAAEDEVAMLPADFTGAQPMRTFNAMPVTWKKGPRFCASWAYPCLLDQHPH